MYNKTVMDHFRNPRNVGVIENANGVGEVGNPLCGDMMTIYLKIELDRIADIKFHQCRWHHRLYQRFADFENDP